VSLLSLNVLMKINDFNKIEKVIKSRVSHKKKYKIGKRKSNKIYFKGLIVVCPSRLFVCFGMGIGDVREGSDEEHST
jgi:hypothetical protein